MGHFRAEEQYRCFSIGQVRPSGWMKQQMLDDLQNGFAGCLDELCSLASSRIFTRNRATTIEATEASMQEDTPRGWWDGETQAVWWDGLLRMAYLSGDQAAMAKADAIMLELLQSQEKSGYIGIYREDSRYKHTKENGEFWTQSRAFVAMLAYYELTGKQEYLDAVETGMALTMQHYGPQRSYFSNETPAGGTCHGLMMVDVCEWLFRITGKETYRDYGVWCYQDYCNTKDVRDIDNQQEHLLHLEEGFIWHTPHTTEHLRVPLWAAYVSGKVHFHKAAENAFTKIKRYLTPSGACIGAESIKNMPPTPEMTYEYCAITELLTSLQSACQKTGLTEFGDMTEWLAFNAAQGARLADGKAINYMAMDNRDQATEEGNGGRRKFSPTHADIAVCCNPNAVKLLPYYTSRLWFQLTSGEGVCAFCYGPSELRTQIGGTAVTIIEDTIYPFSEKISFQILPDKPVAFTLRLRIPSWATGYSLEADAADIENDGDFVQIGKTWCKGDCVKLSFECKIESVVACNGEVAVRRGPLLYSMPIPETRKVLKEYGVRDLADISMTPTHEIPEYLIDGDNLTFEEERISETDELRPWHASPIALTGCLERSDGREESVSLVPLGCTTLRRTTFESVR